MRAYFIQGIPQLTLKHKDDQVLGSLEVTETERESFISTQTRVCVCVCVCVSSIKVMTNLTVCVLHCF